MFGVWKRGTSRVVDLFAFNVSKQSTHNNCVHTLHPFDDATLERNTCTTHLTR